MNKNQRFGSNTIYDGRTVKLTPEAEKKALNKLKKKKVAHSLASYCTEEGFPEVDLVELAEILSNWGDIPSKINDTKACEISLLAGYALMKLKEEKV